MRFKLTLEIGKQSAFVDRGERRDERFVLKLIPEIAVRSAISVELTFRSNVDGLPRPEVLRDPRPSRSNRVAFQSVGFRRCATLAHVAGAKFFAARFIHRVFA